MAYARAVPRTTRPPLSVALIPAVATCTALAACTPAGQSGTDGARLRIAVIDAAPRAGLDDGCVDVELRAPAPAASTHASTHGDDVLAVIQGDPGSPCLGWADDVDLAWYPPTDELPSPVEVATLIDAASADGADLIATTVGFDRDFPELRAAVDRAGDRGAVIVAAAGNRSGLDAAFPARYEPVISVGSVDALGRPSEFSALGGVDVHAPGENLRVSDAFGTRTVSGTSFATARVVREIAMLAGEAASPGDAIARVLARHPRPTQEEGTN